MIIDRRRFLGAGAASLAGALLSACNSDPKEVHPLLELATRTNEKVERSLFRHAALNRVPADARISGRWFPQYFVSPELPMWDPAARGVWRLEVSGLVRKPLSLTLDDLIKLPTIRQKVDHFCVEGWNARAEWSGVRVSELAKLAQATPDAGYVDFQSFDNDYHESWDIDTALHRQTLVAIAMDGRLLGPGHGAPARVHSPLKLGYKNTKYLTKVVFLPAKNGGYWSDQGYEWYAGT
jgi:DMSO/TMAO reductase YedYZ molybdopterin-dependent catalytic subunit